MFPIDHRFVLRAQTKEFFGRAKRLWTGNMAWFIQPSQEKTNKYAVGISSGLKFGAAQRNKIKRMIRAEVMKQEKENFADTSLSKSFNIFILYQGSRDKKTFTHEILKKETNEFFTKMRDSARA